MNSEAHPFRSAEGTTPEPPKRSPGRSLLRAVALTLVASFVSASFVVLYLRARVAEVANAELRRVLGAPPRPLARPGLEVRGSFRSALLALSRWHDCVLRIAPELSDNSLESFAVELGPPSSSLARSVALLDREAQRNDLRVRLVDRELLVEQRWLPEGWRCEATLGECAQNIEHVTELHVVVPGPLASRQVSLRLEGQGRGARAGVREVFEHAGYIVWAEGAALVVGYVPAPGICDPRQSIAAHADGRIIVRQEFVDCVLTQYSDQRRSAVLLPVVRAGRVVGVRLAALAPQSIPSLLGLRSGDVLRRINGLEISEPNAALEAYTRLRRTSDFSVELERNGLLTTLRYSLW